MNRPGRHGRTEQRGETVRIALHLDHPRTGVQDRETVGASERSGRDPTGGRAEHQAYPRHGRGRPRRQRVRRRTRKDRTQANNNDSGCQPSYPREHPRSIADRAPDSCRLDRTTTAPAPRAEGDHHQTHEPPCMTARTGRCPSTSPPVARWWPGMPAAGSWHPIPRPRSPRSCRPSTSASATWSATARSRPAS